MITAEGTDIDPRGYSATKFSSAFTEYLSDLAMTNMEHGSGDVECPTGYFVQLGRRVLFTDDRGFVWHETYNDERGARQVCDALERYYAEWSYMDCDDEEERDEETQTAILAKCDAYVSYVVACDRESCDAFGYDEWLICECPVGPIGGAS